MGKKLNVGDIVYITDWGDVFAIKVLEVYPDGVILGREERRPWQEPIVRLFGRWEYHIEFPNVYP